MRLDKYLKLARIFKRRSVSKDVISFGEVIINGRKAKPATDVKIGDRITLNLGNKIVEIEVLIVKDIVKKEEATSLYSIINETIINENEANL